MILQGDPELIVKIYEILRFPQTRKNNVVTLSLTYIQRRLAATRNFLRKKKILFLPKVIALFKARKYLYIIHNQIAHVNFNRDSPKINFKIYLLLQFFR